MTGPIKNPCKRLFKPSAHWGVSQRHAMWDRLRNATDSERALEIVDNLTRRQTVRLTRAQDEWVVGEVQSNLEWLELCQRAWRPYRGAPL